MTNEKSPPAPLPHVAVRPLLLRALVTPLALLAGVATMLAWQVGRLAGRDEAWRAGLRGVAVVETRATTLGSVLVLLALSVTVAVTTRRAIRQVSGAYEDALALRSRSEAALARLARGEREARARTQEALRTKDEFLSTLSHELRTPLTVILGWSGVLRARSSPPETVSRALAAIERNAKAQAQIVDDLLDASRIVAGQFRLRLSAVDVAAVVHAAYEVVRFSAEAKSVVVALDVDPGPLRVVGDAARLQQIAWNLLSNAVKFTPRNGTVGVRLQRFPSSLRLEVRDSGEGIPTEFLPHVFERFRQADASLKRPHGGLGLGLAIVKHLVDLHGGDVHAESEGPGKGALFIVTLPVGAVDHLVEAANGLDRE